MKQPLSLLVYCLISVLVSTPAYTSKDTVPLYEDANGWQISRAVPGARVTERYEAVLSHFGSLAPQPPPYVKFIYEHGSPFFYMFSLDVPAGITTYWQPGSALVLTYTCGKDTLTAESNMVFFLSKDLRRMFFTYENASEFMVPNPAVPLCSRDGTFALFARFDFKSEPDCLLSCLPRGVRSTSRR